LRGALFLSPQEVDITRVFVCGAPGFSLSPRDCW